MAPAAHPQPFGTTRPTTPHPPPGRETGEGGGKPQTILPIFARGRAKPPAASHRRLPPDAYRPASASETAAKAADGISPVISRAQKKASGDIKRVAQASTAPSQKSLSSKMNATAKAVSTSVLTVNSCPARMFWPKSANDH